MKRLTLACMLAVAGPLAATAQVPPATPSAPAKPVTPVTPKLPPEPWIADMKLGFDDMRLHDIEMRAHDMAFKLETMTHFDMDGLRDKAEQMQLAMQDMKLLDVDRLAAKAEDMAFRAEKLSQKAMIELPLTMDAFGAGAWRSDRFLESRPRAPWAQDDPADSLYRSAREALNRGEYRRSAQMFNEISKKFPKSQYAQDSAYWEAFSRYRLGGTDELKQALKILEGVNVEGMTRNGRESSVDIPALRVRIQGALAARGDRQAEADLRREAPQNGGCDREAVSVRAEALGALGQMDMQAAMPAVKKVLANRDECTVELRRRALYMVGRQGGPEAGSIILDIAKNDTDAGIRGEAMRWLPRVAGENAIPTLEEMVRTSTDEQSQRSAVAALASIDSDRARKAVRTLIERNDVREAIRYDAIISLSREKEGRTVSADDIAYLRSLYTKLETPRLREAVLTSVSRIDTPETAQFLLGVARTETENTSLRATALSRLGRMTVPTLNDIAKLYDVADARTLREQILYALYQRKEPEAVDKMIEIARKDTDPQIRRTAISLLARRNDARAKQVLNELVEKP